MFPLLFPIKSISAVDLNAGGVFRNFEVTLKQAYTPLTMF